MQEPISKTRFKAHVLEVMREIEQTGEPRIITDRGKPTLELRKLRCQDKSPLEMLSDTVLSYENPTDPIADDEWGAAS